VILIEADRRRAEREAEGQGRGVKRVAEAVVFEVQPARRSMRTKKAGHTDLGDNDSEDSDGAESVTGNLPIDSSSDDDDDVLINRLPGAAGEGSGLAATLAMGGMYHRAQAAGGTQPSMLQLCAVLGQPSGPQQATVDGGAMAGVHGATSAANAHGSGQVTAGAAGARRAQGPSVLPEDPNVRRIKAQVIAFPVRWSCASQLSYFSFHASVASMLLCAVRGTLYLSY
jgi:hypothetical protein